MSDTNGLSTNDAPAAAAEAEPPAPQPAVDDDPLAPPPEDQSVFSRGFVDRIRKEAAKYREEASTANTQLQNYDQVFGIYPDEDRQVWFQLARDWAEDPARAAAVMQQIASGVLGDQSGQQQPATSDETPTFDEAIGQLTPEQVREMIDESLAARDASSREQAAINDVFSEVRAAGFDPESADGFAVLYNANHFTGGDIAKAVEMVKARDQKLIDDYVAGRSGKRPMPSPSGGVIATAQSEPITNLDDARRAADAFLKERRSAT